MNHRHLPHHRLTPLLAALLAAVVLGACSPRNDGMTAGQKLDESVARIEQRTDSARAEASADTKAAAQTLKETGRDIKQATENAADKVADAVSDAAITAAINVELAKDQKLSALKINVDTAQGHVALRGTAPDPDSKERASRIAASVKGVTAVDNLLNVAAKS
jgi:osmotically-inducible protein OsmY